MPVSSGAGTNLMDALSGARLSLDGLSVHAAFGERFFGQLDEVLKRISRRDLGSTRIAQCREHGCP
jgi:hypothetical protein